MYIKYSFQKRCFQKERRFHLTRKSIKLREEKEKMININHKERYI